MDWDGAGDGDWYWDSSILQSAAATTQPLSLQPGSGQQSRDMPGESTKDTELRCKSTSESSRAWPGPARPGLCKQMHVLPKTQANAKSKTRQRSRPKPG
ncbi:GL26592 [Drosophila persimilis]|uniref:GL26592 n=1 Tax=Drosophila persimilis TaxID=7234 RepID=B4GSS5_DROPE|nr:GL26592 [Drosophila persimilis]